MTSSPITSGKGRPREWSIAGRTLILSAGSHRALAVLNGRDPLAAAARQRAAVRRPARRTRGDQDPRHPRRRRRGRVRRGRAGAEAGPRPRFSSAWPPGPAARALAACGRCRARHRGGAKYAPATADTRAPRAGSPMIPAPARLRTSSPGPRSGAGAPPPRHHHPFTTRARPLGALAGKARQLGMARDDRK